MHMMTKGGGKTTIASLIERFYDPTEGTVLIDGEDLREFDLSWIHRHIGLVSQEPVLFAVSLKDNIRYGIQEDDPEYSCFSRFKISLYWFNQCYKGLQSN